MFTYIDPEVRQRLAADGKLNHIGADGRLVSADHPLAPDTRSFSVLGPIPLPLQLEGKNYRAAWYASVRHTELSQVQELADDLRERKGQQLFSIMSSSMAVNSVLVFGDPANWQQPLVRVHSSCLTGDVFGSRRCECGPQLSSAIERISGDPEGGMLIYMSGHEGRGIGLWAKAATYLLQDAGEDTYEANRTLGLPDDSRDFSAAATLLKYFLHGQPFRLLTNNPKKIEGLEAEGLHGITRIKHVTGINDANRRYLAAKREWGHELSQEDLGD